MTQLLKNPNEKPTIEIIAKGLGEASKAYAKFLNELNNHDITLMEWRYYNDGKAWLSKGEYKWTTPRGANKVKPLFWLSIWEGFFKVSFYFNDNIRPELLNLGLSDDVKEIIENAKPMGKTMRFIPLTIDVKTDKQLENIYILAKYRKNNI